MPQVLSKGISKVMFIIWLAQLKHLVMNLHRSPKVVGTMPTLDKYLCNKHVLYLFSGVMYVILYCYDCDCSYVSN